jgi:DNA replication and repair protein RecF
MSKVIKGEELNILIGSRPYGNEPGEKLVKLNIMKILNEKYGITEADFLSAELEAVPAFPATDIGFDRSLEDSLNVWDDQLVSYGTKIIERRTKFARELEEQIKDVHAKLSGGREEISIIYEPSVLEEDFEKKLKDSRTRDIRSKMTNLGPHRDDFCFTAGEIDIRKFGSQGQQRTAALSLKLSEIDMMKKLSGDNPVLLLDDVLSELDSNRQTQLLNSIGDIQTIITCTGLDDFVNNRFEIDKIYKVTNGTVSSEN